MYLPINKILAGFRGNEPPRVTLLNQIALITRHLKIVWDLQLGVHSFEREVIPLSDQDIVKHKNVQDTV